VNNDEKSFFRVLKWAGIVALVTVPLVVFLKRKKAEEPAPTSDDDIFEAELKG
jgi:hypothetical protein